MATYITRSEKQGVVRAPPNSGQQPAQVSPPHSLSLFYQRVVDIALHKESKEISTQNSSRGSRRTSPRSLILKGSAAPLFAKGMTAKSQLANCRRLSLTYLRDEAKKSNSNFNSHTDAKGDVRFYLQTIPANGEREWKSDGSGRPLGLEASPGDWLVIGPTGDEYTRPDNQFHLYYGLCRGSKHTNNDPTASLATYYGKNIVRAKELARDFTLIPTFSGGKPQSRGKGYWLVWSQVTWEDCGWDGVYIVEDKTFKTNYGVDKE